MSVGCLLSAGCANRGIVQVGPETFTLAREDHAGIFGNATALRADVIRDANRFAADLGKVAVRMSEKAQPAGFARWASFEYTFRLVDPSDPDAAGAVVVPSDTARFDSREEMDDFYRDMEVDRELDRLRDRIDALEAKRNTGRP